MSKMTRLQNIFKSTNSLQPNSLQSASFLGAAAALFAAGCYFRLAGLGATSMHGDAVFHDFCRAGASVSDLFTRWAELIGPSSGQMPPAAAFTKWVLDVFHLQPTLANVILPSTLWGIATIPVALWVGWRLGGGVFALLLMGVVALNPIHVQMSRMAYFYPPAVLGSFVAVWCLLETWDSVRDRRGLRWSFYGAHAVATVLLFYASAGAWPFAVLVAAFHITCAIFNRVKRRAGWRDLIVIGVTYLAAGIPLLVVPWGLSAMLGMAGSNEATAYWRKIFEVGRQVPILSQVGYELLKLGWGWTWSRGIFSCLVLVSGVVTAAVLGRRKKEWFVPLVLLLVGIALVAWTLRTSVWEFGLRRISSLWPLCFVVLALGFYGFWLAGGKLFRVCVRIWSQGDLTPVFIRALRWCGLIPVALAFGLWIHADMLVLKVNGFDVPYRQISEWLDRSFPKGTPVVTDRFFTAMCEFNRSHPTTNVVVISTVPNELPEIDAKNHFRDVTRRYLEENPDAVFFFGNHHAGRSEVTPWSWPEKYFKRSREFKDSFSWRLALMGQYYHLGHLNLAISKPSIVFYNTIDDIIEAKKKAGETAFVIFGPDWRPVQTQDYRLWRLMMADKASVTIYNVTTNACEGTATVTGVSAGGRSGLHFASANVEFPPNQIVRQQVSLNLKPGTNLLELRRSGSDRGRLLIGRIEVVKSHD
jgi:hypothetical protein